MFSGGGLADGAPGARCGGSTGAELIGTVVLGTGWRSFCALRMDS